MMNAYAAATQASQSYPEMVAKQAAAPSFVELSAMAETMAARAHEIHMHAERIENRLIGSSGIPVGAPQSGSPNAPRPVEPHFATTQDALHSVDRRLSAAMASLNRLADAVGVDRA